YLLGAHPSQAPDTVDCSSFSQWILAKLGISLPRYSGLQRQCGEDVTRREDCQAGDLLFRAGPFSRRSRDLLWFGHVGVAINEHLVAHAEQERGTVVIEPFEDFRRGNAFHSIRR